MAESFECIWTKVVRWINTSEKEENGNAIVNFNKKVDILARI